MKKEEGTDISIFIARGPGTGEPTFACGLNAGHFVGIALEIVGAFREVNELIIVDCSFIGETHGKRLMCDPRAVWTLTIIGTNVSIFRSSPLFTTAGFSDLRCLGPTWGNFMVFSSEIVS